MRESATDKTDGRVYGIEQSAADIFPGHVKSDAIKVPAADFSMHVRGCVGAWVTENRQYRRVGVSAYRGENPTVSVCRCIGVSEKMPGVLPPYLQTPIHPYFLSPRHHVAASNGNINLSSLRYPDPPIPPYQGRKFVAVFLPTPPLPRSPLLCNPRK